MPDADPLQALTRALAHLQGGWPQLPEFEPSVDWSGVETVLMEVAERLRDNYPYEHPLYVGQMLKPPHAIAQLAYALAMTLNPNNHALDGGRATSVMEKEAIAHLARLWGWESPLGHLTGGGTMANLEALWVAKNLHPGKTILASDQAHYTHPRLAGVLGIDFETVASDSRGRMAPQALRRRLAAGDVGTVVATLGTTALGAIDPLSEILEACHAHGARVHVDAAYGGYFGLADNLDPEGRLAFDRMGEADSIVVDPHKHGLQPYGCGSVFFRDPSVGRFYVHSSPYTYFTSSDLHLGEISLECSRPGAAAAALWATLRLLPAVPGGEFAARLSKGRRAALKLAEHLAAEWWVLVPPQLDIVVWAPRMENASAITRRSREIFERAAGLGLHLALTSVPAAWLEARGVAADAPTATCLRACCMKPEHHDWLAEIIRLLELAAGPEASSR